MPEALLYSVAIVFSLIGFITVLYVAIVRLLFKDGKKKFILVLPLSKDDDPSVIMACSNMLRSHPLFSPKIMEIAVLKTDKDISELLEKDV